MKKLLLIVSASLLFLLYIGTSCSNSELKPFSAAFYNVENLYDTIDNPLTRDNDYLPSSKVSWNTERYDRKLDHIARVMSSMEPGHFPSVFGLAEVENRQVVEDLINTGKLKDAGYKIIHQDSPDKRGIDVALLYNPKEFKPLVTQFIRLHFPSEPDFTTRDIIYAKGVVYGADTIHIFVNHWVSRYGGQERTDSFRRFIGHVERLICDSIFNRQPHANILIMGDLNDNPTDPSIQTSLGALEPKEPLAKKQLFDLADIPYSKGEGSLYYKGWDLFDQIIVSTSMVAGHNGIKVDSPAEDIFKESWMLYQPKKGPAVPNRTASSRSYFGGYSDHLPVLVKMKVDLSGEIFKII